MLQTYSNGTIKALVCDRCGKQTDVLHRTQVETADGRKSWVCDKCWEKQK